MKPDPVLKAIRAQPFEPFVLKTAGGKEYRVNHPEFVAMVPRSRVLVVTEVEGGYEIIDLPMIESLSFPENDEKGAA